MSGSASLTQEVYNRLRADLMACRLAPGQKLKINELSARLVAGTSAVREALSRLTSEGFVVLEPQRGFRVMPLSPEELCDLTNTRCEIEGLCIRNSISHGDIEWETNLIAALHRLSRTPVSAEGDPQRCSDAYMAAHAAFHEAVVAACTSRWLLNLRQLLFAQTERYRWLSKPLAKVDRDVNAEHSNIAAAALARDPERAVTLMNDHLHMTARIILDASIGDQSILQNQNRLAS